MTSSSRRSHPCLCPIVRLLSLRLHLTARIHPLPPPSHPLPAPSHPLPARIHPLTTPSHLLAVPSHPLPAPSHPLLAPRLHHLATPLQQVATPQAVSLSQLGTKLQVAAKLPPLTACLSAPRLSSVSDCMCSEGQCLSMECSVLQKVFSFQLLQM